MSQSKTKPEATADKGDSAALKRAVEVLASTPELIERRKTIRPIPTGDVSESSDPSAWDLFAGTTQSMFVKKDSAE